MKAADMNFGAIIIGDEILSGKRQDKHFAKIAEMLLEMCGTNDAAQDKLMELTTWKNAKGEVVEGKTNPFHLNVKPNSKGMTQTSVTYTKVREMYHNWEKENG